MEILPDNPVNRVELRLVTKSLMVVGLTGNVQSGVCGDESFERVIGGYAARCQALQAEGDAVRGLTG